MAQPPLQMVRCWRRAPSTSGGAPWAPQGPTRTPEFELELIQPQMAHKPVLRSEVGALSEVSWEEKILRRQFSAEPIIYMYKSRGRPEQEVN